MTDKVEKAIEQLERISNSLASIGETVDYTDIAIQALEQKQKTGKWVWEIDETPSTPVSPYELNYEGWVCSCCHQFPDDICEWDDLDEPPTYKFCPNCGADMRKSEDKG